MEEEELGNGGGGGKLRFVYLEIVECLTKDSRE